MSDSLRPHGLKPATLLRPWNFPGKNTGLGCHSLPGDLPDPGIEPRSPALQADSLPSEPKQVENNYNHVKFGNLVGLIDDVIPQVLK